MSDDDMIRRQPYMGQIMAECDCPRQDECQKAGLCIATEPADVTGLVDDLHAIARTLPEPVSIATCQRVEDAAIILTALAQQVAELKAENARMSNEAVLKKAECDGIGSLLLDVQRDCIAEREAGDACDEMIQRLINALYLQNQWVKAALECKDWAWDAQQHDAATWSLNEAHEALVAARKLGHW